MGFLFFFNSVGYNLVFIYIAEAYPTKLRDQAQSLLQATAFLIGSWGFFNI